MASTTTETTTRSMLPTTAATDRITLPASELPGHWYNVLADMPVPMAPPIHPGTGEPVGPQDLERLFAPQLIEQEMSSQREIPIPEAVREILAMWRPTPLIRARNLERALGTPARIYFKNEGVSPAGSHKPNTAVPQAYYNNVNGIMRLATETGAGQWGSALAFATRMFGMACRVFMVRVSYEQKPYRRTFMRLFGADVFPSPSPLTQAGRDILAEHPDSPGSLGIAISEAVEEAASRDDTNYALGSVLNHVLLHQTVIGQEAAHAARPGRRGAGLRLRVPRRRLQLRRHRVAVHAGGVRRRQGARRGGRARQLPDPDAGARSPTTSATPPSSRRSCRCTPWATTSCRRPVHAGGLRYHGASPIVSALVHQGAVDAESVAQNDVFKAAVLFAHTEGIVPAPESSHAIAAVVRKALQLKEEGRQAVILFSLSGHGFFDMGAYDAYLDGKLEDFEYPGHAIEESLARLPQVG